MKYRNKFGTINVLKDTKLFNNKIIALSMSGGADSTLLCYLLANTIQQKKLNTIIQPYNGYDLWAPIDSSGVPNIIKFIRNKFPTVSIEWPISTIFNTDGAGYNDGDKNSYINPLIEKLKKHKLVDLVMNGVTMGPPLEAQQLLSGQHPIIRLLGHHLWNEVENASDHLAPFKYVDKQFIIQCYKDFEIDDLLELTNSCTAPQGNCGECWWCQERAWAIREVHK